MPNLESNGRATCHLTSTNVVVEPPNILVIERDAMDATLIRAALADARGGPYHVECVGTLSDALERLCTRQIAAVFANLTLPDSLGTETLDQLLRAAPRVPVIVLCAPADDSVGLQCVQRGAADYLLKDYLDSHSLFRVLQNMIERRAAEEALFVATESTQVTLDCVGDAVLWTDLLGKITYLNLVAETMTGWSKKDAVGHPLTDVFRIVDANTRKSCRNPLERAFQQPRRLALPGKSILIRRDGTESAIEDSTAPIHDRKQNVTGAVIVFHDVTAARAMTVQMSNLAQLDVLTGLPNRAYLNDRIGQAVVAAHRHGSKFALLFVDLDRFKHINDSLGHSVGDALLQAVAKRLSSCVRDSDTVSRHGGDEFVVLLSEVTHPNNAALCAQKVLAMLQAPIFVGHYRLEISASIGISIFPDGGLDPDTLIKTADTAMYQAKQQGRNNFKFFDQEMNVRAVERQSIEEDLRGALERNEFVLQYQPKVDLQTGAISGAEALIRWMHPRRGMLPPAMFVSVAEDSGLILPIGMWVRREACKQARSWQDAGLPPMRVAVNISVVEFRDKNFLGGIRTTLEETCLDPSRLELELTESVLMQHVEATTSLLRQLKAMGVQLTVDDFGTGYSSLSDLRRFPIDALKIDRSFVGEITSDPDDATIVGALISLGRSLKQRVIAEGAETPQQLAFLKSRQCPEAQGFHFSPPVFAQDFARLLETGIAAVS